MEIAGIEILETLVEIPKVSGLDGFLSGPRESSIGSSKLYCRAIELERMAAVVEQIDPKRRSFQPLGHSYMAIYVDNLHELFNLRSHR